MLFDDRMSLEGVSIDHACFSVRMPAEIDMATLKEIFGVSLGGALR